MIYIISDTGHFCAIRGALNGLYFSELNDTVGKFSAEPKTINSGKCGREVKNKSDHLFCGMKGILVVVCLVTLASCGQKTEQKAQLPGPLILPRAPQAVEEVIMAQFPGAMTSPELADSLIAFMSRQFQVSTDKILMGASTCVDDIIYTKNFHAHPEVKGPFHLGGLAGLPFTGISGLEALAHHIPDGGTMVLLVEPHVGYSVKKGWGYIHRHEQHELTTCCGALMGTLDKLQKGTLKPGVREEDYQGSKIAELAFEHETEILEAENPIIELTKVTSQEAEKQIRAHVLEIGMEHIKYIVIITGVMINTDYQYSDYQFVDHILVYDVRKKQFVEERHNLLNH